MSFFISRDYNPESSGYASNKAYTPFFYQLSVFLYRVLGFSIVGHFGWDITDGYSSTAISAVSTTTPIQVTTTSSHGLSSKQSVNITNVSGINANGTWIITVTSTNTFTLNASAGIGTYSSGGLVTTGILHNFGLVNSSNGAGINFGSGHEKEVSIPLSIRTVSSNDIGKMLVLKSNIYPNKNSGCFKITSINYTDNRYIIDYRSADNPPKEINNIDWWLYENEIIASNYISNFQNASVNINNATNTTPIQITTTSTFSYANNQKVIVSGVVGNTAANGTWFVTPVNSTTLLLNGSVSNGSYVSGGIVNYAGYNGSKVAPNSRIILQSPHIVGWQVRLAAEPTSSNLPNVSVSVGYNGNSIGDFPSGIGNDGYATTHVAQFLDITPINTSVYTNYIVGGGHATIPPRMTIMGDGYSKNIMVIARSQNNTTNNSIISFGLPDNEQNINSPNGDRLFCYGGAVINDFGSLNLKISSTDNIGFSAKQGALEMCSLSSWANLDGTSLTSPLLSSNASDSVFTNTTELLPIEIWSGINTSLSLVGADTPPFFYDQRFMGTAPYLKNGRANFGDFTLTSENTSEYTITNATNTSPIQISTSTSNSLTTGQVITISEVLGNTAANGFFEITVINNTTFSLNNTTGNSVYTSGGVAKGSSKYIHLQNGIYLQWNSVSNITT